MLGGRDPLSIPLTTSSGLSRQKFNYHLLIEFDFSLLGSGQTELIPSSRARLVSRSQKSEREEAMTAGAASDGGEGSAWYQTKSRAHRGAQADTGKAIMCQREFETKKGGA